MLRGFATVNYFAADLDAATKWYTEMLGVPPYFDQVPGYREFRIGDYQDELGLVDAAYGPAPTEKPAGQVIFWHVDDLDASLERLLALGATLNQPRIDYGTFSTASVVDPFGNVLGIMYNPHYAEVLELVRPDQAGLDALKE
ncbi:VOC family protein [Agromyces sp. ISL-38]|uniref:VOC family protein n=1 Tax=Agromyces sp. ISL-38 TaxID=2819107 RepID=UPI001BE5C8D4|nr:VOC family protein [Agromyces sp. ISL-38]MBT2498377.1 VOC family protein [Agromyces sp. ISL-38]MBT2518989.1 VOC family protein [Streptomyces sp. ISL-90]